MGEPMFGRDVDPRSMQPLCAYDERLLGDFGVRARSHDTDVFQSSGSMQEVSYMP